MSDATKPLNLVEQLRLVAEMDLAGSFAKHVCVEAADEIVRLRNNRDRAVVSSRVAVDRQELWLGRVQARMERGHEAPAGSPRLNFC